VMILMFVFNVRSRDLDSDGFMTSILTADQLMFVNIDIDVDLWISDAVREDYCLR